MAVAPGQVIERFVTINNSIALTWPYTVSEGCRARRLTHTLPLSQHDTGQYSSIQAVIGLHTKVLDLTVRQYPNYCSNDTTTYRIKHRKWPQKKKRKKKNWHVLSLSTAVFLISIQ